MNKAWPIERDEVFAVMAVAVWLAIVGFAVWSHAIAATEPPVWDALTYSLKSKAFWTAIETGKIFNPFALDPTTRPPGIVLISYPFGFSEHYAGFYFRTNFIPAILLTLSVLLVGSAIRTPRRSPFVMAGMAVCVGGIPPIFQFQFLGVLENVPSAGYWGLVDNFISGVAALAASSLVLASTRKSWRWAGVAAWFSAFCLWIKPAGLLIMGCMLFSFGCIAWREIARTRKLDCWIVKSFAVFLVAYLAAGIAAFFSPYFSNANIEFGSRVIEVARAESHWSFGFQTIAERLHVGTGWGVVVLVAFGAMLASFSREYRWTVPASLLTLALGGWFWLIEVGDIGQVRYFLPFALVAAIFLLPAVIESISGQSAAIQGLVVCMLALPALASTVLAASHRGGPSYQRLLGINVTSSAYPAEGRLGESVLDDAESRGLRRPKIYVCSMSTPLRNFGAVINYGLAIGSRDTKGTIAIPVDWSRGFAFRFDEILSADYLACDRTNVTARLMGKCEFGEDYVAGCGNHRMDIADEVGKRRSVASFDDEYEVVRDWLQTLDSESGVEVATTEHMLLLQIVDKRRFEVALADFASRYNWRPITVEGYSSRWWSESELQEESERSPVGTLNIKFRDMNRQLVQTLRGLRVAMGDRDATVDIWLQPGADSDLISLEGFRLFCHLESADGTILAHSESRISQVSRIGQLRQYRLVVTDAARAKGARFGIGVYGPGLGGATDPVLLRADSPGTDWGSRRFPLPAAPFPSGSAVFGNSPDA